MAKGETLTAWAQSNFSACAAMAESVAAETVGDVASGVGAFAGADGVAGVEISSTCGSVDEPRMLAADAHATHSASTSSFMFLRL